MLSDVLKRFVKAICFNLLNRKNNNAVKENFVIHFAELEFRPPCHRPPPSLSAQGLGRRFARRRRSKSGGNLRCFDEAL